MSHLQELLQTALISTKHIEGAAIISEKDSTIKSSTKNFNLTNEDCLNCVEAFKNPPQIREDGFEFHEAIFSVIRADKDSIYCTHPISKAGLILAHTNLYVIIALYIPPMYPAVCVEAVEKLADYFRTKGH